MIAGDLGAQGERVARCKLGWTVSDIRNPRLTLSILHEILRTPSRLEQVAGGMQRDAAVRPIQSMWSEYSSVYRTLVSTDKETMDQKTSTADSPLRKGYVAFLATRLAEAGPSEPAKDDQVRQLEAELVGLRQLLQSPRHRIAEAVGNTIQKIPVLWPAIARVTEAILHRERARAERSRP